jgi:type VI secretion system protein ImpK
MTSVQVKDAHAQGRLTRCAGSLLSLLIVLRKSRDLDSMTDLRLAVGRLFQDFRGQARGEEISQQEIDDASYPLAASFDEILLGATWEGKDAWQRDSLAKQYCNDEFVGDGFYDKLAEVRRSVTSKREVVEVFYYCLIAGFQGRMIESASQRESLIDELSREIGTKRQMLSPNGLPVPEGGKLQPIKRFPWPMVVFASVIITILFWLLSWSALDRHADKIVRALGGS